MNINKSAFRCISVNQNDISYNNKLILELWTGLSLIRRDESPADSQAFARTMRTNEDLLQSSFYTIIASYGSTTRQDHPEASVSKQEELE